MQVPSILLGESRTRLIQGMVIGAVASMVIGFSWGGWVTGATANKLAADQAGAAVVTVLTPICVDKFMQNGDAQENLAALRKSLLTGNRVSTWRRAAGRHGPELPPPTSSWPGRVQRN
jgi:dienelactone hydrolase